MTVPIQPVPDPRILANLQRLKDAGAGDEALNAYLAEESAKGTAAPSPQQRQLHARDVARRMTSANEADAAQTPGAWPEFLGGVTAFSKQIPGATALQAGARSVIRGQPYTQALQDIRGSEADNPMSGFNGLLGGSVAAAATPGGPMLSGARYGIMNGLLGADPATLEDRLHSAAGQGTVGAIAGGAGNLLSTGVRAIASKTLGAKALAMKAAMKAADEMAYGKAGQEAATHGTSPAVQAALDAPIIKPYADVIRNSPVHAGANDATVLQESYKLMSEHQGKLQNAMANATDFKAGTSLGAAETKLGKNQLLDAAETPWTHTETVPALSTAQSPHPSLMDALKDFNDRSAEAARRAQGGAAPNTNPFSSKPSAETFSQRQARDLLERQSAERIVSPSLSGAPGPRTITTDMPAALPSLRAAVEQHAQMAGLGDAFNAAADATKRIAKGSQIAGKKLATNSPEAFMASIQKMTPEQASAAIDGLLGRLKGQMHGSINPLKLFGLGPNGAQLSRMSPYLSALDKKAGNKFAGLLSNVGAAKGVGLLGP